MIRLATAEDSANIAALSIQVWLHNYAKTGIRQSIARYVLSEFTEQNIHEKIELGTDIYFVVEEQGNLIGYASLKTQGKLPNHSYCNTGAG